MYVCMYGAQETLKQVTKYPRGSGSKIYLWFHKISSRLAKVHILCSSDVSL